MYKIYLNKVLTRPEEIRVSAFPFNRTWPGKQRDINQSERAYMLRVFGEGELNIEIETDFLINEAVVRPLSRNVNVSIEEKKISFSVYENGKFSIEINGVHHAIHLIYQKKFDRSGFFEPQYHFKKGHHYPGLIELKSGESVYIEEGAVVHGSVYAHNAENIKIYGDGILCGDWEKRDKKHGDIGFDDENSFSPEMVHTYGGIRFYQCENIFIGGIAITDTASYAVSFFAVDNITVENVSVLGIWKYNCDGIDFFNSSNVKVKDCFIRSFDDSMCMKGLTAFSDKNTENVCVTNTVFWCDWGKNLDIGLATACSEIKNITWRDCDIIHNSSSCIAISNGQWADINGVLYENIRVEYSKHTLPQVLQKHDGESYDAKGQSSVPVLIAISDKRRNWQGNIASESEKAKIRNVCFNGIYVVSDRDKKPEIKIKKFTELSSFENIELKNIFFNSEAWESDLF